MKKFIALCLALFVLAPVAAQAGGFRSFSYGRGGYGGYGGYGYSPVVSLASYSLFVPFVPVQQVYQQPVVVQQQPVIVQQQQPVIVQQQAVAVEAVQQPYCATAGFSYGVSNYGTASYGVNYGAGRFRTIHRHRR